LETPRILSLPLGQTAGRQHAVHISTCVCPAMVVIACEPPFTDVLPLPLARLTATPPVRQPMAVTVFSLVFLRQRHFSLQVVGRPEGWTTSRCG
jgi:hypothetical protein